MPQETHEWQRKRDKQTYLKMLEGKDGIEHDAADAYYDPKQFRGSREVKRGGRLSKTAVVFLVVGTLLLVGSADYALKGKVYHYITNLHNDKALTADPIKQKASAQATDDAKSEKSLKSQLGGCAVGEYANVQDVKIFRDYVDEFFKSVEEARPSFTSAALSKNEKISVYNKLVLQSKGAIGFYNERLVKCYSNVAMANEMQEKARRISESLKELNVLIK